MKKKSNKDKHKTKRPSTQVPRKEDRNVQSDELKIKDTIGKRIYQYVMKD